jgi:uncharacterized oligopeptide transporter (OPT) family protein
LLLWLGPQSAILGYGIFRLWGSYGHLIPSFSIGENVIVQTTAVATATMPLAAGAGAGTAAALGQRILILLICLATWEQHDAQQTLLHVA